MLADRARRTAPIAAALLATFCGGSDPTPQSLLAASPGSSRFEEPGFVAVPGGSVNAAGGNLLVRHAALSIDTKLGTWEIGAVYNSKTRRWLWSFDARYDGSTFVDPSGAVHEDLWYLADGALVPGTAWIKVDATRMRSVGGLVHEFDGDGRLAAVHWASDAYPRLEHRAQTIAGAARTTEIRQCGAPGACTSVVALSYDANGRLVSLVDRAGRMADLAYDANGWLLSARDALDVERGLPGTRYEYRDDQRLFAMTSSEGERLEYRWHWNQGRVTEVRGVGAEGFAHRFEYAVDSDPEAPHVCTHVDPLGARTLYRFDGRRRLRRVTLPTGEVTTREWSGLELASLVLPGGATTRWEYAGVDEVVRTDPGGNAVRFDFRIGAGENRAAPFRRPIERIEDSIGVIERRGYDAKGRLAWIENGAAERTTFEWGADNLLARRTGPDGVAVAYAGRGEHGHAEELAIGGEVATRAFDAVGNLVATSGLERFDLRPGGEVARRFDGDRNVAEILLADAGEGSTAAVRIEWRSDHRPSRIARPGGGDHEFAYDALGRLVARHERAGGATATILYEVDASGRRTAETLPNGMRRETTWDAAGRESGLAAYRGGALEGELSVVWADAHPAEVRDSRTAGPERFTWDETGELAAIDFPEGERLEIARDARGRTIRETYRLADGSLLREIGFGYDGADRPTRITEGGATLVERVWRQGRLASTRFGSGLVRSHAYDPQTGLASGAVAARADGSIVEVTSLAFEGGGAQAALRLVAETASAGPAAAITREELELGPPQGPGRRLLAWSDGAAERSIAYDALSNTTALGQEALLYDAEGARLLARIDRATGEPIARYAYDAAGFCTSRDGIPLEWTALGQIAAIGSEASFDWDLRGRPLRRRTASGEVRTLFGGRVETDAAGFPMRLDLGTVVILLDTGGHRYRHLDFRGNVKLESDDAGEATRHLRYAPYGVDATFGAGPAAASFAGGLEVTGLLLIGARVLDPAAGRFLSPDPLLHAVNQYAYALGNPVAFWDPDGRRWRLSGFLYGVAAAAGGSAVGAATGAAAGSATLGGIVGGPIGAVLGLAVAEALYQQLEPGSHGPFALADVLEMATPLYVAPPDRGPGDCRCSARATGGGLAVPAPDPGAQGASLAGGAPVGIPSLRFGAWGAGTSSGAVGGGFSGW